jgi:hypothetical protein
MQADLRICNAEYGIQQNVIKQHQNVKNVDIFQLTLRKRLPAATLTRTLHGTIKIPSTLTLRRLAQAFNEDYFEFVERLSLRMKGPRGEPRLTKLRLDAELDYNEYRRVIDLLATLRRK